MTIAQNTKPEEIAAWMQISVCLDSCHCGGNFAFKIPLNNTDLFILLSKAVALAALKLDVTAITILDSLEKCVVMSVGFFPKKYTFESFLLFNMDSTQKRLSGFGKKWIGGQSRLDGVPDADVAIQKLERHEGHISTYSMSFRNYGDLCEEVELNTPQASLSLIHI